MAENHELITPEQAGHWEGTTFVFNEPLTLPVGKQLVRLGQIDQAHMVLANGMSPDDFITMLLNFNRTWEGDGE